MLPTPSKGYRRVESMNDSEGDFRSRMAADRIDFQAWLDPRVRLPATSRYPSEPGPCPALPTLTLPTERGGFVSGLYTSGDWHVKEGAVERFIAGWQDLADWTAANVPGCTFAKLLQDRDDPRHFVSFSPWRDEAAVSEWRSHPGFGERVERLRESLESFAARTLTVAGEIGPATPDPW